MKQQKVKYGRKKFTLDDLELTLLALPTTIWFAIFSYLPMFGVIIAFKRYQPQQGMGFIQALLNSPWVGFENFEFLFATPDIWMILRNTLGYNIVMIILGIVVPCSLALIITNLYSQKLAKVCQTMMFLPNFLSWVVITYFVFAFLSFDKGIVNSIFESLGMEAVNWYTTPSFWPPFLVFLSIWKGAGYGMVVYIATITGIDNTLYEAAVIDGATKWQQTKSITIPMLRPIIAIMLIMSVGRIFSTDFGLFYNVPKQQGMLYNVTTTLDVYVYNALMRLADTGRSSAAALFQSVAGLIMITLANYAVKRVDGETSLF